MKVLMENWNKFLISESSLSRILGHIEKHDCAVITAFRNEPFNICNCDDAGTAEITKRRDSGECDNKTLATNKIRNRDLKAVLLNAGYGVTSVQGSYIENFLKQNAVEVKEDSAFVVNLQNDENFLDTVISLGKKFCQDSVLIIPKGGKGAYLYGTNNGSFPGYDQKTVVGDFGAGREKEFMTKVGNRPFTFAQLNEYKLETFENHSKNSRWAIRSIAKSIMG